MTDYTMKDFRAEMLRRGVTAMKGRPPKRAATQTPAPAHGNTITKIVPCGVHPLHVVKVRTNGSRSGCPMCEMQIEYLCRRMGSRDAK